MIDILLPFFFNSTLSNMSSYGAPSLANVPQLNEVKAFQDMMSLLQHIDKGELQDLLDNEAQINDIISDNEEVGYFFIL